MKVFSKRARNSASADLTSSGRRTRGDRTAEAWTGRHATTQPAATDPALVVERDRLIERFTIMQAELGGLFYEMAIRDHVRMEILMRQAAALQRVDAELAQVEHLLAAGTPRLGGRCAACGAVHAVGAAFCSHCARPLAA